MHGDSPGSVWDALFGVKDDPEALRFSLSLRSD